MVISTSLRVCVFNYFDFDFLMLFHCGKNTEHETYLCNKLLSVQYSSVNYGDNVEQQIARTYSSCTIATLCLLIRNHFPPSPALANHHSSL